MIYWRIYQSIETLVKTG